MNQLQLLPGDEAIQKALLSCCGRNCYQRHNHCYLGHRPAIDQKLVIFCLALYYVLGTIDSIYRNIIRISRSLTKWFILTLSVFKKPDVRCRTVETLGFAALFALCGDGKGVIESLVALPVHSLQLNSDADLLKCFRKDEQRDSKLNFDFSKPFKKTKKNLESLNTKIVSDWDFIDMDYKLRG